MTELELDSESEEEELGNLSFQDFNFPATISKPKQLANPPVNLGTNSKSGTSKSGDPPLNVQTFQHNNNASNQSKPIAIDLTDSLDDSRNSILKSIISGNGLRDDELIEEEDVVESEESNEISKTPENGFEKGHQETKKENEMNTKKRERDESEGEDSQSPSGKKLRSEIEVEVDEERIVVHLEVDHFFVQGKSGLFDFQIF